VPKSHQPDAQKLRQLETALEECEKFGLANRYVSAIMHEVNNPLEAITNLVYITKTHRDDPAIVAENMETIEQQLAVLSKVTSQALAFHRKEVEAKEWDLVAIAESALKLHAAKIARHRATTHTRFDGHAPVRVMGTEILQVLSNLILNALDALPSEDGRIHVRVRTRGKFVHIVIADNGSGIPAHIAPRLFEPYLTSKPRGTGLGLWLSKRIIAKHGGQLAFRSSLRDGRQGTAFRIVLPRIEWPDLSKGESASSVDATTPPIVKLLSEPLEMHPTHSSVREKAKPA
jgi:signal transduction histidine kinase